MPTDSDADLRPEIALGWRRSMMNGLDPGMEVRESRLFEVDRHSRLIQAADPVLTRLANELNDTRFSILLADHSARIVDRRNVDRTLDRQLDRVKAVPGAQYVEEVSGTNSLATAFELRRPIAVTGEEHFLEALRMFCCYGAPIVHPITRRLEGVLDVTGPVADINNLLGPFLMRAVRDIEQRLQNGSRLSEQRLFAEFQMESARKKSAILLFGENLALSNAAAMDLVSSDDHPTLRALADDLDGHGRLSTRLALTSGREVKVNARVVDASRDGFIIEVVPEPTGSPGDPSDPVLARYLSDDRRGQGRGRDFTAGCAPAHLLTAAGSNPPTGIGLVSIIGAPGSGKTTRALELAGEDAIVIDFAPVARSRPVTDLSGGVGAPDSAGSDWSRQLVVAIGERQPVVVDNLHLAELSEAAIVRSALAVADGPVVLVASDEVELSGEHRALLASVHRSENRTLLRDYGSEFPDLVRSMVESIAGREPAEPSGDDMSRPTFRVTPSALDVLADQDWPGNFTELRQVLTFAVRGRTRGDITVDDLPETYRQRATRALTPLEKAERATIRAALATCDGNKAATATYLGIGRNTLYQRIRYYQIS